MPHVLNPQYNFGGSFFAPTVESFFVPKVSSDFSAFVFENDFLATFPELFAITSAIILLTSGVIISTSLEKPILHTNWSLLGIYGLILTLVLIFNQDLTCGTLFFNTLVMTPLTLFLKKLLILASIFTLLIGMEYNKMENINQFEMVILILISTFAMAGMIQSADLISLYLAIELQSLCLYVMAAMKSPNAFSSEAGLKYFLLGAFSSGILLFGCSLIYGFTGTTDFMVISKICSCGTSISSDLADNLSLVSPWQDQITHLRALQLGMIFLLVALLFKITAVPFHVWAPDVYEGAPTSVTAFFSLAPKVALLCVMIRIFHLDSIETIWQKAFIISSLLSMVWGSFAALSSYKIKRLIAFSSISHVGYMLLALSGNSLLGVQSLCIYISIYVVMTTSMFASFLLHAERRTNSRKVIQSKVSRIKYIRDLSGLSSTNKALALCLTLTLFSMGGIPPLAGFYAKAGIFLSALAGSQYILAIVGVATSVLSSFYYIRLVNIMYFEKNPEPISLDRPQKSSSFILAFCCLFMVSFIAYPGPLYLASHLVTISI